MYWAYVLNTNLEKFKNNNATDLDKEKKVKVKEKMKVTVSCGMCGQGPYFCMCADNNKLMRETDIKSCT